MTEIGELRTAKPIEKAMSEIRNWLDKIQINQLNTNINYDARQNVALVRFNYKGKNYEFRSTNQKNCRLNLWAIARVMEYKVRAHIMKIEQFDRSMQAYLQIEASPEAQMKGMQQEGTTPTEDLNAYAILGISPLSSNNELKEHYKNIAKSWHPDMAGSTEAKKVFEKKFSEISQAWEQIKKTRGI